MPILWNSAQVRAGQFRTGVSLHSHTLHSEEPLDFARRAAKCFGLEQQLNRLYWTPPVAPLEAYHLEAGQLLDLGLQPLVSLTDHDNIGAGLSLRALGFLKDLPLSVEWTVPYGGTFFHLGVHDLSPGGAQATMRAMAECTRQPTRDRIADLLRSKPGSLTVFNHPLWDEKGIGKAAHRLAVREFLHEYGDCVDALELNGMRPWHENQEVMRLAEETGGVYVSGGDRHGLMPNPVLNVTNASSFAEFAAEVRSRQSHVMFTANYWKPFVLRVIRDVRDVLALRPHHGLGWTRWDDRVFRRCDDGPSKPLSALFPLRALRLELRIPAEAGSDVVSQRG